MAVTIQTLRAELTTRKDQIAIAYCENTKLRSEILKLQRELGNRVYPATKLK